MGLASNAGAAERPNVLLICIDDLRPELACYGSTYIDSPHIDALAETGCLFQRHYVQAPTCGASRSALLTGRYGGAGNDALFRRAELKRERPEVVPPSLPGWFRQHGYQTLSIGKVSHHPGGRGGPDWNDDSIIEMPGDWSRHLMPCGDWLHPRGAMHGLARGEIRDAAGSMAVFQSAVGDDSIYPDGLITGEALTQLQRVANEPDGTPFLMAVGLIRPHLPFGAPAKYLERYADVSLPPIATAEKPSGRTTWHRSGEFMKYDRWGRDPNQDPEFADAVRRHYAACVSYADAQVGRLLDQLDALHLTESTIVVLWGDHGWHLGEHAVWGKHTLFEESLRSPLIIRVPGLNRGGERSASIVESIDVFPTLCQLAELPVPDALHGQSLVSKLAGPNRSESENESGSETGPVADASFAYSGGASVTATIRNDHFRLVLHPDGFGELYDHRVDPGEQRNVADDPQYRETLRELTEEATRRLRLREIPKSGD
jgi:iduronate 2-sulfatase